MVDSYKFVIGLFVLFLLVASPVLAATSPAPVYLGTAGNFTILSKAAITNVPTSNVTGDVGASPIDGASIGLTCGQVTGTIYAVDATGPAPCSVENATLLTAAVGAMGTAYTNATGRVNGTGTEDYLNEGAGTLDGLTLYTGIHKWTTGVSIGAVAGENVTLDCQGDANAVFIMQVAGTLNIASETGGLRSNVLLTNGCQASNIFWAVAGATTLGTYSTFKGTIMTGATSVIALQTNASLTGRALSDGAVTLQSNTVASPIGITDITPPVVTLNTQNNSWTNNNQSSFNFTFFDGVSATANCSLFINGAGYNASVIADKNVPALITPNASLAEGAHSWYVNCTDLSNNTGTSSARMINIDKTAPAVGLVSPADNAWSANATPAFTFNYTDAASNASCILSAGGAAMGMNSSVINNTNTVIIANASLGQGNNTWYVNCTDQASNVGNSSARTVRVDSIYPVPLISNVNGVSSGYGTSNATLLINFTANDTNIRNWTLSVYNSTWGLLQNWTENTSNISAVKTYAATANGTYYVNLTVRDNAANANASSFTVYVDQSAPVIYNISASNITSSSATLTVNVSDVYSGINNCTYSNAGSGNLTLSSGLYTANLSGLNSSAAYTVNVTCRDKAGYSAINATSFTTASVTAQSAVDLGTAGNFVILTKSGISTTGTTSIIGNIGVSPIAATAITGFGLILDASNQFATSSLVNGSVYAADYAPPTPAFMTTAVSDMETAYTAAAGLTLPDYTELGAGNIGGMTLAPGLYKWSTGVTIPADVTLYGNSTDVWVFQIAQTLTVSSGKQIILSGGAQAKNIFWQVAGQTTLGTTSVFNGNILDYTAIVFNNGAVLNGRALAQTAVTLIANNVSLPTGAPVLTTIRLTPASANLSIGSTLQMNATSFDQFNASITAVISYASSNVSVATVNATTGLVTAVAPGNATINATSGAVINTSAITVEHSPPVLNYIGSRSVTNNTWLNFTITATSPSGFNLTFAVSGKPASANFTDLLNGTATFSWLPNATGTSTVNFTVADTNSKSASEVITITVNAFQAPATVATNPGSVWKNVDFNVTLNATGFNNTPIAYINYSLNNVSGQINGSSGNVLINASGNNTLRFYAVDNSSNVETLSTIYALLDKVAPNITSFTLSASSVSTGGALTGTCTVTDNLYAGITGVITGIDTSTAGSKTATCTATDLAGNIATATAAYTVTSSGGSGGSGGSIVSDSQLRSFSELTEGAYNVSFTTAGITNLELETIGNATDVRITVTRWTIRPAGVSTPDIEKIYGYLEISHTNLDNSLIGSAKIRFKVDKAWMARNNIQASQIALYRFTTAWDLLETRLLSQDSAYYYFEATSPGLSYFAIGTAKAATTAPAAPVPPAPQPPADVAPQQPAPTEPPAVEQPAAAQQPAVQQPAAPQAPAAPAGFSRLMYAIVFAAVVVVVGVVLYLRPRSD